MSNLTRRIKRNAAKKEYGTRDHNIRYKLSMKRKEESEERRRKEQEKADKNLNLE